MKYTTKYSPSILLAIGALLLAQTIAPMHLAHTAYKTVSKNKALTAAITLPLITYYAANKLYQRSIHWDWKNIDETHINGIPLAEIFKQHAATLKNNGSQWLWGTGTSAHQVEGDCTNNQWYLFEGKPLEDKKEVEVAGIGCDHWNRYKEDIQLMKQIGTNTYRFSVEWSKVMPQQGVINKEALAHYKDVCKELIANGIKPVITLYHYTEPIWFYEMGGFEKEENIQHFVDFCKTVFTELHEDVHLWLTFNSPEGVAAQGWLTATKPPAKKGQYVLMAQVLHHLLEAHVRTYQALKSLPGGQNSRVGMLKNIMQLDPWNVANPLDHFGCYIGSNLVDASIYNFFNTGIFSVYIPGKVSYTQENTYLKNGGKALDFIGLNYYAHNYMSNLKTFREPNQDIEIHTNNTKYTIYGEGLYRAIKELSKNIAEPLNVPMYVTENGIGTDNDAHRELFHRRYLYALAHAIKDGYNVHGYILWSLMDNYEWGQYSKHYGVFKVDRTNNLERTLKPGAQYYVDMIKNSSIHSLYHKQQM